MDLANLSVTEALWALLTATLLGLHVGLLREAVHDRAAVEITNGAARTLVADANVTREASRVVVQSIILAAALFNGLFVPRGFLDAINDGALVTIVLFIVAQSILVVVAYRDTLVRRKLVEIQKRNIRAGPLGVTATGGTVVVESAPGKPTPEAKQVGGEVVITPVSDEPEVKT